MPEPTSTSGISLAALSIALLGPMAGPYALIVFAALAGALWPLSAADTMTRSAGAWLLLRCTLTAVVLTSALSLVLQNQWQIPANEALAPVAFAIGALGNGWRPVFEAVGSALQAVLARAGGPKP
ncbi:hypothetical protein [Acidovorax sp. K2F]|uniref:hypothetical protein n=1 Tax=Acidovorax sp. K2F TaxID=2978125 RepID=UPI0021B14E7B|nr:hypothetical protein [Acidovorax sp. K2F]MCT6721685.1 hypothetical protein [Acidovorax sp. K2F]